VKLPGVPVFDGHARGHQKIGVVVVHCECGIERRTGNLNGDHPMECHESLPQGVSCNVYVCMCVCVCVEHGSERGEEKEG
jgi:hypothetical protein